MLGKMQRHSSEQKSVVFEQPGVFIHLIVNPDEEDKLLSGTLSVYEESGYKYFKWSRVSSAPLPSDEHDTQVLSGTSSAVVASDATHVSPVQTQEITSELRQPSVSPEPNSSDPDWTVVADSNKHEDSFEMDVASSESQKTFPFKYDFTVDIEDLRYIRKSKKGLNWKYLVLELKDGANLPTLHFHEGGSKNFLKAIESYVMLAQSSKVTRTLEVMPHNNNALTQSFDELNLFGENGQQTSSQRRGFLETPISSAYSGLSKVTNYIQDFLNPAEVHYQTRPKHERATLVPDEATEAVGSSRIQIKQEEDTAGGFEMITCADLGPRSEPTRSLPINEEFWNNHKDEEGRIIDVDEVKRSIFRGGIDSNLRKEVWKYLLNYYIWDKTTAELKEHKEIKEENYYRMKMQWKSIDADQESRFTAIRENKSLIDKDVTRTDRTRIFYEGQENVSLKLLNDVLMTYCMFNFDLGYVQGMSDLLSPILEVMGSEVDAFWCFVGYMDIVQHNFDLNQRGMKVQLRDLHTLIQYMEPKLWDHLEEKESSNLYFCFRWLLIRFKREFSFEDIQTLWEVSWTGLPCRNFHLVMCLALLDTEKSSLMKEDCGFTEILKHVNEMSGKIELQATLRKAEGIYLQLAACRKDLPDSIRQILDL
uniref:TBC1 domain family member 15 n=1 Tax=Ciona intestinalis TaxID=7719 RepID=UPI000521AA88|nr:TBC1 domain family member 15 [Ciona intestinalis]|eukprot:XP_002123783.3 TBC1 domain family member 15 [Ciona intestinalis]